MGASMMDSVDAEDQDDSELDGSDSELEELVSNCSTMTQISGQSLDAQGEDLLYTSFCGIGWFYSKILFFNNNKFLKMQFLNISYSH